MAMVAYHDLDLHQIDVKITFLNDKLEEEIYMKHPKDFLVQGNEYNVYRLHKALYELK